VLAGRTKDWISPGRASKIGRFSRGKLQKIIKNLLAHELNYAYFRIELGEKCRYFNKFEANSA